MSSIPALSSISNLSDLIGSNKTSTDTDNSLPFQSLYNLTKHKFIYKINLFVIVKGD